MSVKVEVKRITTTAKLPKFAHYDDACADLYADERIIIASHERVLVSTGIKIALPKGYEAQIRPRSGLALKEGLMVINSPGTIDSGYRGEVKVILYNSSNTAFEVTPGLRLAQIAVRPVPSVIFEEVEELNETERSIGGFGSTGTN